MVDGTEIFSRVSLNSFVSLPRIIVKLTVVPDFPRILSTATSVLREIESLPSIFAITSPAKIPARAAGVPSIGATTSNCFLSFCPS